MTFPTRRSSVALIQDSTTNAWALSLPAHQAGDLIIVMASLNATVAPTITGAGWTLHAGLHAGTSMRSHIIYKTAESAAETLTINSAVSQRMSAVVYVYSAFTSFSFAYASGDDTACNPPPLTPPADDDYEFIIVANVKGVPVTADPSGWSDPIGNTTGSSAGITSRALTQQISTAVAIDPAAFTQADVRWVSATIAVRGPAPPFESELAGEAVLSGITAGGSMSPLPDGSLSGEAVLSGVTASGEMGMTPGTITTPVLKNNTGTVLASVSGIVANVYHPTTGALVVRKTGLSSNGSGIVTISDAALSIGTTYAYELDLSATSQGRRLPTGVAA